MKEAVREAFLAVRNGNSPDAAIADPELNQRFLDECRARGLTHTLSALNLCLLNLRKAGELRGLPKSKRVRVPNQEEYRFASEIAVRFLERRDGISLDLILCDPAHAARFDEAAAKIAPGFSPFHYRWAALNLRKRKRLGPELLARVVPAEAVVTCKVTELDPKQIPVRQGLYLFLEPTRVLYIGECRNLCKRIGQHLDHSDNRGLAHWLWEHGASDLHVEYHVLPKEVSTRVRKALEAELIRSRKPIFNVAGVAPDS
jgi:hypothetical protein